MEDRVATVPNAVTLVRLCLLPLFGYLLLVHHPAERYGAAWLLGLIGATDWVDGYLARHLHQVSELGKILDPVADRIVLIGGVAAILYDGSVPTWVAVVALSREAIVAVTALVLAGLGAARIDVTWWGKAGTFGLLWAFPLFLCGHSDAFWHGLAERLAWVAAIPGMVLGMYALVLYIPAARAALVQGRAGREEAMR